MLGLFSQFRIYIIGALILVCGVLFLWYRHSLIVQGENNVKASVARAIQQQQQIAYENADILVAQSEKIRTIIKKIPTPEAAHVPNDVSCNWNDATQRMFNSSIDKANAAAKSN